MTVNGVGHVYVETREFERAIAFWQAMGFQPAESWGEGDHRACRLVTGATYVVLANCSSGHSPQRATIHFATADAEALDAALAASDAVQVVAPLEDTHWGTRWIRVQDPDGNLYVIEASK